MVNLSIHLSFNPALLHQAEQLPLSFHYRAVLRKSQAALIVCLNSSYLELPPILSLSPHKKMMDTLIARAIPVPIPAA